MPGPVHFVLGDAAGGSLRQQLGDVRIVVTRDLFTEGPCRFEDPAGQRIDDHDPTWMSRRNDWWEQVLGGEASASVAAGRQAVGDLSIALRERGEAPLVVWVADASSEQLHLCWWVSLLAARDVDNDVRIARPPSSGDRFIGVGSVPSSNLASATYTPLSADDRTLACALWSAFVAPTPSAFDAALRTLGPHPLFGNLAFLRNRFPEVSDGLGWWERRLLERLATCEGEKLAATVGHVMGADVPDFVGDLALFHRLSDLSRDGLLERSRLTELGHAVLEGNKHRAAVRGFDRWIGGTHVQTPDALWCRDGDRITRLASPQEVSE